MNWLETILVTLGISLDIFAAMECKGAQLSKIEKKPLVLRGWRPSDRMILPEARGARSLKRLYAERGIAPSERDGLPVLCADREIAAAAGIGAAAGMEIETKKPVVWTIRVGKGEKSL